MSKSNTFDARAMISKQLAKLGHGIDLQESRKHSKIDDLMKNLDSNENVSLIHFLK